MQQPIATSRLLMDLEDVARSEGLTPFDPWGSEPEVYPDAAARVVVMRLDGSIERLDLDLDPDWRTVAAYRFENVFGEKVEGRRSGRLGLRLMRGRYHVVPLHGVSAPLRGGLPDPDARAHGVQVGGTGGRIIGDGWRMDRGDAERLALELNAAFEHGQAVQVEA